MPKNFLYPSPHTWESRWECSPYPSTPIRELGRQCLYTLITLGSHAETVPRTLPLLSESKAGNACTLSSHSKVIAGMFPVLFHSCPRVNLAMLVNSHHSRKSRRECPRYPSTPI